MTLSINDLTVVPTYGVNEEPKLIAVKLGGSYQVVESGSLAVQGSLNGNTELNIGKVLILNDKFYKVTSADLIEATEQEEEGITYTLSPLYVKDALLQNFVNVPKEKPMKPIASFGDLMDELRSAPVPSSVPCDLGNIASVNKGPMLLQMVYQGVITRILSKSGEGISLQVGAEEFPLTIPNGFLELNKGDELWLSFNDVNEAFLDLEPHAELSDTVQLEVGLTYHSGDCFYVDLAPAKEEA